MRKSFAMLSLIVLGFVVSFAAQSQAATTVLGTCTVMTPPATISSPGFYCLNANSTVNLSSGNAITISANDVVLDLNGYKIEDTNGGSTTAYGIATSGSPKNVVVRNGNVIGFYKGISLSGPDAAGFIVEHIYTDSFRMGIESDGGGSVIRNNFSTISAAGASTSFRGIYSNGADCRITDNDIDMVANVSDNYGIEVGGLTSSLRSIIEGNRITNYSTLSPVTGVHLVSNNGGGDHLVVNNRFVNMTTGIAFDAGVTGKYRDNLFTSVTTTVIGGTDAGNNN